MDREITLSEAIGIIVSAFPKVDDSLSARFEEIFLSAEIGVHLSQTPVGFMDGESFNTSSKQQAMVSMEDFGAGKKGVRGYADPQLFLTNFQEKFRKENMMIFNASMSGADLLRTALSIPECDGIGLSSGTQEQAIMLRRGWLEDISNNHLK